MAPILHCVRHAQGFHNLGGGTYSIPDPQLTPKGVQQCEELRETSFPDQSKLSLIMASPLCRALHTAYVVFEPTLTPPPSSSGSQSRQPLILAVPDAQETSDDPCDVGSDPDVLQTVVTEKNWPVDLSLVQDGWNDKSIGSPSSPASDAIAARAKNARILIRQKIRELVAAEGHEDVQVVLVTHGSYLHYLTNDWEEAEFPSGTGWVNCETRRFTFEHDFKSDADEDAMIVETTECRQKRGKDYPTPGREAQVKLFEEKMRAWGDMGLQRPDLWGKDV